MASGYQLQSSVYRVSYPTNLTDCAEIHSATLVRRLAAWIIDGICIFPFLLSTALLVRVTGLHVSPYVFPHLVAVFYLGIFWSRRDGQTPGKRVMGIQVIRIDGRPVIGRTVVARYMGYVINTLGLMLGWFALLLDDEHRGWHDRLARTVVIRSHTHTDQDRSWQGTFRVFAALLLFVCILAAVLALIPSSFAFKQGVSYYEQGKYEQAIARFDEAIRLDPHYASAYYHRGYVYYLQGDYEQAIHDYDAAIRLNPGLTLPLDMHAEREETADCEGVCLDADTKVTYNSRGNVHYIVGHYEQALADFDQVIRRDPDNVSAFNSRGNINFVLGEYEQAIADYDQALYLNPYLAVAYYNRGHVYYIQAEYDLALADFIQYKLLAGQDAILQVYGPVAKIEAQQK